MRRARLPFWLAGFFLLATLAPTAVGAGTVCSPDGAPVVTAWPCVLYTDDETGAVCIRNAGICENRSGDDAENPCADGNQRHQYNRTMVTGHVRGERSCHGATEARTLQISMISWTTYSYEDGSESHTIRANHRDMPPLFTGQAPHWAASWSASPHDCRFWVSVGNAGEHLEQREPCTNGPPASPDAPWGNFLP